MHIGIAPHADASRANSERLAGRSHYTNLICIIARRLCVRHSWVRCSCTFPLRFECRSNKFTSEHNSTTELHFAIAVVDRSRPPLIFSGGSNKAELDPKIVSVRSRSRLENA